MPPLSLHPIQPTDEAPPGYVVFACWRESDDCREWDIRNFWLVMVVREDMMPEQLRRARPTGQRRVDKGGEVCAVWVVGKGEFRWLPRKEMYYQAADQLHEFRGTEMFEDFRKLYNIVRQKDALLERYQHEILADKARLDRLADMSRPTRRGRNSTSNRASFVADDEDGEANGADSHLEDSSDNDIEQPARKRSKVASLARTTRTSTIPARPLPSEADALVTAPTYTASTSAPEEPQIKPEVGDDGYPVDLMDVHIGGRKFRISEVDIQQSDVLRSYIMRKPGRTEPWIMDPDLTDVSAEDFEAVRQFLQSGEFEPVYIHTGEDGSDMVEGNGSLEGIRTVEQDSEQICRLGRLYVLARRFALAGMRALVFRKIKAGFPAGWAPRVMLGMVEQLWRDVPGTVDDAAAVARTETSTMEKDGLKEWLVGWLAFNVQFITESGVETAKMFWTVLNRTPGLRLAVSRVDARNVERYKGVLVDLEGYEGAVRRGRGERRQM